MKRPVHLMIVISGLLSQLSSAIPIREGFRNCSGDTLAHTLVWDLWAEGSFDEPTSTEEYACNDTIPIAAADCFGDLQKTPFQELSLAALDFQLTRFEESLLERLPKDDPVFFALAKLREEWDLLFYYLMEDEPLGAYERFDRHGVFTHDLMKNLPGLYCHSQSLSMRDFSIESNRALGNLAHLRNSLLSVTRSLKRGVHFWSRFKREN